MVIHIHFKMRIFMALQVPTFLDNLLGYYRPAPVAAQTGASVAQGNWIPGGLGHVSAPIVLGSGGGHSGHHVQVIASNPETIQELRRNEREDRENSQGTLAAIIGGICTVVLAGAAAFVGRNFLNSNKELNDVVAFRDQQLPQLDARVQETLRPIVNKHVENLESKAFWAKTFVVLTVGALVCAAAAFAGGMLALPWLITAAVVGGVFTAASGAFAGVWYMTEDHSLSPQMLQQIEQLRAQYL